MKLVENDLSGILYEATKAWEEGFQSYENVINELLNTINDLHQTKENLSSKIKEQEYLLAGKEFEINQYKSASLKLQEKEKNEAKLVLRANIFENKYTTTLAKLKSYKVKPPSKNASCQTISNSICTSKQKNDAVVDVTSFPLINFVEVVALLELPDLITPLGKGLNQSSSLLTQFNKSSHEHNYIQPFLYKNNFDDNNYNSSNTKRNTNNFCKNSNDNTNNYTYNNNNPNVVRSCFDEPPTTSTSLNLLLSSEDETSNFEEGTDIDSDDSPVMIHVKEQQHLHQRLLTSFRDDVPCIDITEDHKLSNEKNSPRNLISLDCDNVDIDTNHTNNCGTVNDSNNKNNNINYINDNINNCSNNIQFLIVPSIKIEPDSNTTSSSSQESEPFALLDSFFTEFMVQHGATLVEPFAPLSSNLTSHISFTKTNFVNRGKAKKELKSKNKKKNDDRSVGKNIKKVACERFNKKTNKRRAKLKISKQWLKRKVPVGNKIVPKSQKFSKVKCCPVNRSRNSKNMGRKREIRSTKPYSNKISRK